MKLVRWMRFTWELKKLPPLTTPLAECYSIRAAERGEQKSVSGVILSAFAQDSAWSDALKDFKLPLQNQIDALFTQDEVPALVICHGPRIIGASAMLLSEQSENHLISGPCVLMEYRNRGLGTALLYHSLTHLALAGLPRAHGITKDNVVAGKFIYPKFGSSGLECEFEPAQAGT
jgi:Acetyltransferase (GNAT) family